MKEIVVISGKGGTGKTSLTASFSYLEKENIIVADCDVDAADMHLLLAPDFANPEDFYSGVVAKINQDICIKCGKCYSKCRFDAISKLPFIVNSIDCEGCGFCARICPVNAIEMNSQKVGKWYKSEIRTNTTMVHAKLRIGAENSGKLVAKVKNEAKTLAKEKSIELVLIDGSPGIGCPVVSSLSGANLVVLVTEPSVSGFHDLKRVYELVKKFGIKACCIINKFDVNLEKSSEIKDFLALENIELISEVPYTKDFTEAMTNGKTIVESDNRELVTIIKNSWEKIKLLD